MSSTDSLFEDGGEVLDAISHLRDKNQAMIEHLRDEKHRAIHQMRKIKKVLVISLGLNVFLIGLLVYVYSRMT